MSYQPKVKQDGDKSNFVQVCYSRAIKDKHSDVKQDGSKSISGQIKSISVHLITP